MILVIFRQYERITIEERLTGVAPASLTSVMRLVRLVWYSSVVITFWSLCPNWIVTIGLNSSKLSAMLCSTPAHLPSALNETVVAPLFAGLIPAAGSLRSRRKPSPHPPFTATVESPVRMKYGGLLLWGLGAALIWPRRVARGNRTWKNFMMIKN